MQLTGPPLNLCYLLMCMKRSKHKSKTKPATIAADVHQPPGHDGLATVVLPHVAAQSDTPLARLLGPRGNRQHPGVGDLRA